MRLDFVVLYTSAPVRLADFYRKGLGLTERLSRFDGRYLELEAGGVTLAICDSALVTTLIPEIASTSSGDIMGPMRQLSFSVEDVEKAAAQSLRAGGTMVSPAAVRPWKCEVAIVRDPDGQLIEFCRRLV